MSECTDLQGLASELLRRTFDSVTHHFPPLFALYLHFICLCYSTVQKIVPGVRYTMYTLTTSVSPFLICMFYSWKEEISPCSHWQHPTISLPPFLHPFGGLEISHFVFQGGCYLLEPQGQLFTLGSWVLIQGCDDLDRETKGESGENGREVGNNKRRERRGRIGQRRVKEECRKSKETRTGETERENERRTKRKKKGGEWEERMVSFDINSHVIKAVVVCEPHLGETDSPICLPNLFIRFCLSLFRDLKWQCAMDA